MECQSRRRSAEAESSCQKCSYDKRRPTGCKSTNAGLNRPGGGESCSRKSIALDPAPHPENVSGLNFGIKLDVIATATPDVARVAQKIVNLINLPLHRAKLVDWNIDE